MEVLDWSKFSTGFTYCITTESQLHNIEKKEGMIYYLSDTSEAYVSCNNIFEKIGDISRDTYIEPPQKHRKIIRTTCQFCGAKLSIFGYEDIKKCEWCDKVNVIAKYYD